MILPLHSSLSKSNENKMSLGEEIYRQIEKDTETEIGIKIKTEIEIEIEIEIERYKGREQLAFALAGLNH